MLNIRKDFPYLLNKNSIIYLDNAATTQKPIQVIEAIKNYYQNNNYPVHRSIYKNAEITTQLFENSRKAIADFIGANEGEIIFTSGTTESINFVSEAWARHNLKSGDQIIISELEHHSNILPWIRLAKQYNIILKYIKFKDNFELDYQDYLNILNDKTKLISITSCANSIGYIPDLNFIIDNAKKYNAKILVDAAQTIGHKDFKIIKDKIDFLAFSGHKILGPTGIGVLYASKNIQKSMVPYKLGGGSIINVSHYEYRLNKPPYCYEAGTPAIAQVIGLAQAINYIQNLGFDKISDHENLLYNYLISELSKIKNIKLIHNNNFKPNHIISFYSEKYHSHDIADFLSDNNIAVRAGNQCSQIIFKKLGINSAIRLSFYLYNNIEELTQFIKILKKLLNY